MVITLKIPWKEILQDLRWPFIILSLYMILVYLIDLFFPLDQVHVPLTLITVPGTLIGLLLAFRTNSAYDRWWEARIIWGAIVNDSRTLIRQLKTFSELNADSKGWIGGMALRQIAWSYSLSRVLRKQDPIVDVNKFLHKNELKSIEKKGSVPNALLYNQGSALKKMYQNRWITDFQFVALDKTLSRLTDCMGKCERIKNTVFPSSYSRMVDILIYLFIIFLPFGLVDAIGFIIVPVTLSIAFAFLVIERIAIYMQDPFECRSSDTPMTAISKTIEINIREELDLGDVPEPPKPINGVLM